MKIQEQLRQDLLAIFGFKNCKFGRFNYGDEQDILWVEILDTKISYNVNSKEILLQLQLSYSTPSDKCDIGFLNDRLQVSKYENKNRLTLNDTEQSITYNSSKNDFKRVMKTANYIINEEFNTERMKINNMNFNYKIGK